MRLIDADELKELFSEVIGHIAKKPEMNGNLEHMIRASAMVIQMIDDAPTVQPEHCGDAVSRNAIIQKLNQMDRYVSAELRLCDTDKKFPQNEVFIVDDVYEEIVEQLPSAQPETCEGCKHLGKWENEVEYGYPSPCTRCKRRVNDNYER